MIDEELSIDLIDPPNNDDKLITTAEDWWNNACINTYHNGWSVYALGYKDAADILVKFVETKKIKQDTLVYPIIFLYRQYLELAIKDLICQAHNLLDIRGQFPKSHNINELWRLCDILLEKISPGDSRDSRKEISRLIREFSNVDPISTAFRYPEDKDGNPSLPNLKLINLRNVRDVIAKIDVIIGGACHIIDDYLSYRNEMGP